MTVLLIDVQARRPVPRLHVAATIGMGIVLSAAVLLGRGWRPDTSAAGKPPPAIEAVMPQSSAIEETYGVRFTAIVLTGSAGIVQLRYQVLDASKATALHDEGTEPWVRADGVALDQPALMGHAHAPSTAAGRTSSIMLANTAGVVRPGDRVTLHMGSLQLDAVTVL